MRSNPVLTAPSRVSLSHRRPALRLPLAALAISTLSLPASARAQHKPELGLIYAAEHAQSAASSGGAFWLQGAGADLAVPIYKSFAVAGSFSGGHAGHAGNQPGQKLNKLNYLVGPRYTADLHMKGAAIFGQALFGGTHGYQGLFPTGTGVLNSQTAFAMQLGGGLDIPLRRWAGIRAPQIDYLYSSLSNGGNNAQNDFRLGFGAYFRFGAK